MRLITKRDVIRRVPARWHTQYPEGQSSHHNDKGRRLDALDLGVATEADVDAIIGNHSWTNLECDACGMDSEVVLRIVDKYPDDPYENVTADLCPECIGKAYVLAGGEA